MAAKCSNCRAAYEVRPVPAGEVQMCRECGRTFLFQANENQAAGNNEPAGNRRSAGLKDSEQFEISVNNYKQNRSNNTHSGKN